MTGIDERVGVLTRPVDLTDHPRSLMRVARASSSCAARAGRHRSSSPVFGVGSDFETAGPVRSYAMDPSIVYGQQGAPWPVASAGYSVGRDKDACGRDGMGHAARDG